MGFFSADIWEVNNGDSNHTPALIIAQYYYITCSHLIDIDSPAQKEMSGLDIPPTAVKNITLPVAA